MGAKRALPAPAASLTWEQVSRYRLKNQHLLKRMPPGKWQDVVSGLGGVHAQVMSAGELIICTRADGVTPENVRRALWEEHTLVKSWGMRGTLHLFTAEDYPLVVGALRTRQSHRTAPWLKYHNLTLDEMDRAVEAVRDALDGRCLTREELANEVARITGMPRLGEKLRSGWGELLKPAAFQGWLCFGPSQGQTVTFVRPDQWIGGWRDVDSGEAMNEMLRRFLRVLGPATRDEFARWFGVVPKEVRPVFERMEPEIAHVDVEGHRALALASTLEEMAGDTCEESVVVRLLPMFDPYTLGVGPHVQWVLAGDVAELKPRLYRTAGWVTPAVVVDGRIEGVWGYEKGRKGVDVGVEMFVRASPPVRRGIEEEAERLGGILNAPIELTVS
jgi:hypothetical protein